MRVRAAILVGGGSRRLGRDKAREPLAGSPIVTWVARALAAVACETFLVGKDPQESPRPDLPFVADKSPERSALAGVAAALGAAGEGPVLVVACDHPLLEPALLRALVDRLGNRSACVPKTASGFEPLVAVYDAGRAGPVFRRRLDAGRLRLSEAVRELSPVVLGEEDLAAFDPELRSFLNVNEEADLELVREIVMRKGLAPRSLHR